MTPRQKFDLSLLPEKPDLKYEKQLWKKELRFIAGVDEAGRGALAGPVAAGAVVLPCDSRNLVSQLDGVRDSKEITSAEREAWAVVIKTIAIAWGVGFASANEIDLKGIVPATHLAIFRAFLKLDLTADHILVDYLTLPEIPVPQTPLVKGDARSLSIACASILAKTARDEVLIAMDQEYPGYQFSHHKGYATKAHQQAIQRLGPCDQHRRTFSPVTEYFSLFPPGNQK